MKKLIEVHVFDKDGDNVLSLDHFDTLKEGREFVKSCGLKPNYWDQRAESEGWALRNVETLQLCLNGEIIQDWFPEFAAHLTYVHTGLE